MADPYRRAHKNRTVGHLIGARPQPQNTTFGRRVPIIGVVAIVTHSGGIIRESVIDVGDAKMVEIKVAALASLAKFGIVKIGLTVCDGRHSLAFVGDRIVDEPCVTRDTLLGREVIVNAIFVVRFVDHTIIVPFFVACLAKLAGVGIENVGFAIRQSRVREGKFGACLGVQIIEEFASLALASRSVVNDAVGDFGGGQTMAAPEKIRGGFGGAFDTAVGVVVVGKAGRLLGPLRACSTASQIVSCGAIQTQIIAAGTAGRGGRVVPDAVQVLAVALDANFIEKEVAGVANLADVRCGHIGGAVGHGPHLANFRHGVPIIRQFAIGA